MDPETILGKKFRDISLSDSSSSKSGSTSASYIYCDNENELNKLRTHIDSLTNSDTDEVPVLLDCEGDNLGRVGGKLGLVQIGLESNVYLVDVIEYPESLGLLREILEKQSLLKIVWDGRSDYAELWHGHRIAISPVLDLQLVRVYQTCGGVGGQRGFIALDGMGKAFSMLSRAFTKDLDRDISRLKRVQEEIKARHKRDETDFWIRRPLHQDLLDYASFDILQLRALYRSYSSRLSLYPHIADESKRYVEIYKDYRREDRAWYVDHGVLPQEILERSPEVQSKYNKLGTKKCGGCSRELHKDSFNCFIQKWQHGQLCYTCAEAKRFRERRRGY